jgi:hypothetical protein
MKLFATLLCCIACLSPLMLAGCSLPEDVEGNERAIGGETPEAVIRSFFDSLNTALQDPEITEQETRQVWAERLATYFAPSERIDQRDILWQMLADFATRLERVDEHMEITLEVTYEGMYIAEQSDDSAMVRLVGGTLHFRRVWVAENGYRSIVTDQRHSLNEVLGQSEQGGFAVLRVNGRWFLTER